ncbi:UDP-N-acetylglucosamine 2-epimerase (non-hydrolyzing) [soil metagenome]
MKIITVIGARPQFIKAAALSREFALHSTIQELIVHTGQHFDENMSGVFFKEMEIPMPTYNLNINSLHHGAMTGEMLIRLEDVYLKEKPDLVVVFGDTNSTLAGALTAVKLKIPIAHIEAGLRSFNKYMPEEINRVLTDRISDYLFCPTLHAIRNLENEGYRNFPCTILHSGDVMQDAMNYYSKKVPAHTEILDKTGKDFILCTLHRASNTDDEQHLKSIIDAVNELSIAHRVVFPIHPRTKNKILSLGVTCEAMMIDPVGYFDMIQLLRNCKLVLTDSGGLQKEAYFNRKPCVTLREETEWTELTEGGFNRLSGCDTQRIVKFSNEMMTKELDFSNDLYGGGFASKLIVDRILSDFQ